MNFLGAQSDAPYRRRLKSFQFHPPRQEPEQIREAIEVNDDLTVAQPAHLLKRANQSLRPAAKLLTAGKIHLALQVPPVTPIAAALAGLSCGTRKFEPSNRRANRRFRSSLMYTGPRC